MTGRGGGSTVERPARPINPKEKKSDDRDACSTTGRPHRNQEPAATDLGERRLLARRRADRVRGRASVQLRRPARRWRVLDVATGSGNAAIAAARHGCEVVGVDYVPSLLEKGRLRAEAEGLSVEFVEADAEELPFADAAFDAVTSVFGAMFAPDHWQTASELMRVCG